MYTHSRSDPYPLGGWVEGYPYEYHITSGY